MSGPQMDLIQRPSPEEIVRQNLERAMIRHGGDIQKYYDLLLEKVPEQREDWAELRSLATLRLRARR